ncbi:TPA: hypothetical protein N0F65_001319 [Lagenidium giganteum]|uniref:Nucleoporin protein Ndc1-Nup n=1 Tax=Lagenidium giganteum TaxID=4803 RepID=A0AAV2Z071_9STRA|nr:TPA: hypothetical protein N0F65_001319 [Lagenidium giganteum]
MGFVLHALMHVCKDNEGTGLDKTLQMPFPHLQQRLQQAVRGVVLLTLVAVVAPFAALCFAPASQFDFPGIWRFGIIVSMLVVATWLTLALRFVLLPAFRSTLAAEAPVTGSVQGAICGAWELLARVYLEPQLLVVLSLSMFHSWIWKRCSSWLFAGSVVHATGWPVVMVSAAVSFYSFVSLEQSLTTDPFVLQPSTALMPFLLRDAVRALRRGVAVVVVLVALGVVFVPELMSVHSLYFHLASSCLESFAWLATASIFRIMLFRATYESVQNAVETGALWESICTPKMASPRTIEDLFKGSIKIIETSGIALADQLVTGNKNRVDAAVKAISSGKLAGGELSSEQAECLDNAFKFENLGMIAQFDKRARSALFGSATSWQAVFSMTTGMLDSFTLSLQMLNTIPERRAQQPEEAVTRLERSLPTFLQFLVENADTHPLLLLDKHPHLTNLHIASTHFESKIQYYVDSRVQFAARRYLMEEARRRVFSRARLIVKSRSEDASGVVKHAIPAVLTSLVECRRAVASYMDISTKNGIIADSYMKEATSLRTGLDTGIYQLTNTFFSELPSLHLPAATRNELTAFVKFDA